MFSQAVTTGLVEIGFRSLYVYNILLTAVEINMEYCANMTAVYWNIFYIDGSRLLCYNIGKVEKVALFPGRPTTIEKRWKEWQSAKHSGKQ